MAECFEDSETLRATFLQELAELKELITSVSDALAKCKTTEQDIKAIEDKLEQLQNRNGWFVRTIYEENNQEIFDSFLAIRIDANALVRQVIQQQREKRNKRVKIKENEQSEEEDPATSDKPTEVKVKQGKTELQESLKDNNGLESKEKNAFTNCLPKSRRVQANGNNIKQPLNPETNHYSTRLGLLFQKLSVILYNFQQYSNSLY